MESSGGADVCRGLVTPGMVAHLLEVKRIKASGKYGADTFQAKLPLCNRSPHLFLNIFSMQRS